jgi:hypothetical protein
MPRLKISGPDLVDSQTKTPQRLWGVCIQDPLWQSLAPGPRLLPHGKTQLAQARLWGANCVRVPFHPVTIRHAHAPTHAHTQTQTKLAAVERELARLEQEARALDLHLIIDFHGIGFPATQEDFHFDEAPYTRLYQCEAKEIREFWEIVAKASAQPDSRIIALELYNEATGHQPTSHAPLATLENWILHRDWADELLETVIRPRCETLALIGGLNFGYDLEFALHEPIHDSCTAYTSHPYPHHARDKAWDRAFGILSQTRPVLLTEVGFSDHGLFDARQFPGPPGSYAKTLREYADRKRLSFCAWNFSAAWEPVLLADQNYRPSPAGEFFKTWMLSLAEQQVAK